MSEASLWNYLRKILPPEGHYSRIESQTSAGFPDVHFTIDGVSGTIELKSTKHPNATYPFTGGDGLRKSQLTWIEDELKANGLVWLCLQCGRRIYFLDAPTYYQKLHEMTLADIEMGNSLCIEKGVGLDMNDLRLMLVNKL